ncbi:hypothetical protein R3P38DRAFT_3333233 [Favolaschia claudopus]|uniref:F-box domain-containing protein n=1 Tax=Favolaschia claudopus TaxID=2862362 RepID=A0AAV9ZJD2_9AGAR
MSIRKIRLFSLASKSSDSFFALSELVLFHLLEACALSTVIALSHTSSYFRSLVKALFRARITAVLEHFLGHVNTSTFFALLQDTDSAIGGSTVARVLAPPVTESWMPTNLNMYVPKGKVQKWEDFMELVAYSRAEKQPGVDRRYAYATTSHTVFESGYSGLQITISESVDDCTISPAVASSTTLTMAVITGSTIVAMYPSLISQRRAHNAWESPTVAHCIQLQNRGFKHGSSTTMWTRKCGWNCPVLWRRVQSLRGVGLFCWGGPDNVFPDNGSEGIPFTDASMQWRLGDVCMNGKCPWSSRKWE